MSYTLSQLILSSMNYIIIVVYKLSFHFFGKIFITKKIPTICGLGPEGENYHRVNEFVYIDSIIKAYKIYALTAFDFLK